MSLFLAQLGGVAWSVVFISLIGVILSDSELLNAHPWVPTIEIARWTVLSFAFSAIAFLGLFIAFLDGLSFQAHLPWRARFLVLLPAGLMMLATVAVVIGLSIAASFMFTRVTIQWSVFSCVLLAAWSCSTFILGVRGNLR